MVNQFWAIVSPIVIRKFIVYLVEGDVREKRALIEENLELQMRLDELTPVIAEKESRYDE